ncbi:MAG: HAD-IC family P-type ATPase [Candidatus Kerfeldbacteria bacterium]|nr:HAD-IC family P-type ATPase [Candidatus Kerfeldbacteria bacterium]
MQMISRESSLPLAHQSLQTQHARDVFTLLKSSPDGLAPAEANQRLLRDGLNAPPERERRWFSLLLRQYATPLVLLLVAAAVISFLVGDRTDGLTIVGILIVNGLLGFIQEFKSARSLRELKRYLKNETTVRRRQVKTVNRTDLVVGDVVLLKIGDAVPADLRLTNDRELRFDESTLTGESQEVAKSSTPLAEPTSAIHQCTNLAFAGTVVLRGEGEGIVIATGARTVMGSIAKLVASTKHVSTFEQNLRQFSSFLIKIVAISLGVVFLTNLLTKGTTINLTEQLLFALALAVSVIPEALPAVTTITLSRGAIQLAKKHVVVKRLSAIEDLGHIDVLCTDKTGTLTENRLAVTRLITAARRPLIEAALQAIPNSIRAGAKSSGDPFDLALLEYAQHQGEKIPRGDVVAELPFDPERRRSGSLVRQHRSHRFIVRGAPESVLPLCQRDAEDHPIAIETLIRRAQELGRVGERVIALASRDVSPPYPTDLSQLERNLVFLGFVSFVDPIKPTSRRALLDAEKLGVTIKIVTGDSPGVAGAVARKLGLIRAETEVISGEQLDRLSDPEYDHAARTYRVFARMAPSQKYRLIRTLQASSSVGFLGEGINDTPSLKLATVAIVVNSAADAARETADIVLLDKSLQVIVDGIHQGRMIFANVLKYIKYTLVGNFGNFFAIAGISLITNFLPMLPVQILLTNILTDFPLVAVAGDRVDPKEVRRPQHFRLRELGFLTLTLGLVSSLFDFIFFGVFHSYSPATIQTLWFTGSILSELILIYSIRTNLGFEKTRGASPTLIWLTLAAGLAAVALPFSQFGQTAFHFISPSANSLFIVAAIVLTYFVATEMVKQLYYRNYRHHPA